MNQRLIKVIEERKSDIADKIKEYKGDIKEWQQEQRLADNLRKAENYKLNDDEKESLEYESLALGDLIRWREYHLGKQQQELNIVEMKLKYLNQIG